MSYQPADGVAMECNTAVPPPHSVRLMKEPRAQWPVQCGTNKGRGGSFSSFEVKGTNPALKKSSNIPEIYAKVFGRFH